MAPTTRLGLDRPSTAEQASTLRVAISDHADTLDQAAIDGQGLLSARAIAGLRGRYFYATDTGRLYRDTGSAWETVNPVDAAAGTASMRTLGTGSTQAAAGNDSRFSSVNAFSVGPDGTVGGAGGFTFEGDGQLYVARAANAGLLHSSLTGDLGYRFALFHDGRMEWGDGSGPRDVGLERGAPNLLRLLAGDDLAVGSKSAYNDAIQGVYLDASGYLGISRPSVGIVFYIGVDGDAYPRYRLDADGGVSLGPGGSPADTYLGRDPAGNKWTTPDAFEVGGELTQSGIAVVTTNDARLSDQRIPTDLSVTHGKVAAANKDGAPGTPSMRTLGTGANQATAGNDSRLSNARTPTSHAASHGKGQADAVSPASIGALASIAGDRIVGGVVNANGTINIGQNFTSQRIGVGSYLLTFSPGFSSVPTTDATNAGVAGAIPRIGASDPANVEVFMDRWNGSAFVPVDSAFTFKTMGAV